MLRMQSSIWIVIVNYRTSDLTIDCLRSLSKQVSDLSNLHLVVVDNSSGDDSVLKITDAIEHEGWSSWVEVLPLDQNGGFAFGNNASIRQALASNDLIDYVILLNPDTTPLPGSIKTLVDFMDANPDAGIAGSQLVNVKGGVECSAHSFPSPLNELNGGARLGVLSRLLRLQVTSTAQSISHQCDWVSGASMIIRRKVLEDIDLMDEAYFLYFEEVDFCRRAHQAGWECWYVPDSRVIHLEGASTDICSTAKRRAGYWYDSRRRYFVKFYGITGLVAADLLWAIGRFTYLLRRSLFLGARGNHNNDPKFFMFDLLWGDLRAILTGRVWSIRRAGQYQ